MLRTEVNLRGERVPLASSFEGRVVFENLKILYGRDFSLLEGGYLAVEEGVIVEVGRGRFEGKAEGRINGRGLLAVPGLINAHIHLGDSAAKELSLGLTLEKAVSPSNGFKHRFLRNAEPETLVYWMEQTLKSMVSSGITCFADFREDGVKGVSMLRKALGNVKARSLILARPSIPQSLGRVKGELEELKKAADGIGVGSLSQFTDSMLSLIAESFKGVKLLAAHAAEAEAAGVSEVERAVKHLRADLLVHMVHVEDWELEAAARAGVGVVVCPRSNASFGLGLPDLKRMEDFGLKVGLGTDNVMVCQPDMFREMEFTSRALRLKYKDPSYPPPEKVFRMATVGAAEALGLDGKLGSLEEGKLADMVFLDLEASNVAPVHSLMAALVHRVSVENVMLVVVGGKIAFSRLPLKVWKA